MFEPKYYSVDSERAEILGIGAAVYDASVIPLLADRLSQGAVVFTDLQTKKYVAETRIGARRHRYNKAHGIDARWNSAPTIDKKWAKSNYIRISSSPS